MSTNKIKLSTIAKNGERKQKSISERTLLFRQILAISGPCISQLVRGCATGYSTTMLPELRSQGLNFNTDEETWVASILIVGACLGGIMSGYIVEKLGRKLSSMLFYVFTIMSWLAFCLPLNFTNLFMARFLSGIITGISGLLAYVYVSEISNPKYRSLFLASVNAVATIGIFVVHFTNTFVSLQITAIIISTLPILALLFNFFVPESPQWLMQNHKKDEAIDAFKWLRGDADTKEVTEVKLIEKSRTKPVKFYKSPTFWKGNFLTLVMGVALQGSGYNIIEYYSITILRETFVLDAYVVTLVLDLFRIIFSIIACYLTQKVNIKSHIVYTTFGGGVCMFFFALSLKFPDVLNKNFMLMFLLGFVSFMTVGLYSATIIQAVQLYPFEVRAAGMSFVVISQTLLCFGFVKVGLQMFEFFGTTETYFIYAFTCLTTTTILYYTLPDVELEKKDADGTKPSENERY